MYAGQIDRVSAAKRHRTNPSRSDPSHFLTWLDQQSKRPAPYLGYPFIPVIFATREHPPNISLFMVYFCLAGSAPWILARNSFPLAVFFWGGECWGGGIVFYEWWLNGIAQKGLNCWWSVSQARPSQTACRALAPSVQTSARDPNSQCRQRTGSCLHTSSARLQSCSASGAEFCPVQLQGFGFQAVLLRSQQEEFPRMFDPQIGSQLVVACFYQDKRLESFCDPSMLNVNFELKCSCAFCQE